MKKKIFKLVFNIFFSAHHSDQMSEGSQGPKVTICVQYSKVELYPLTQSARVGIELPGQLKTDEFEMSFVPCSVNRDDIMSCVSWALYDVMRFPLRRHCWHTQISQQLMRHRRRSQQFSGEVGPNSENFKANSSHLGIFYTPLMKIARYDFNPK